MDIEQIQKINNLALDLMRQGLASTREEAIAQAEKTFNQESTQQYNDIKGRMEEAKEENKPEEVSQERIKEILERNTQFIVKKMREFQEKMENFQKEISLLKAQINTAPALKDLMAQKIPEPIKESQVEQVEMPNDSQVNEPEPQQEQPIENVEAKPAEPQKQQNGNGNHPRSGNFEQEDVSIEKFFYMGNR